MSSSSVLQPDRDGPDALTTDDVVMWLPIQLIDEDPNNPRQSFDDAELDALADTVAEKGLLQPITVRPADADGRYRLRFGARRLRAAHRAGLGEIRAVVQFGGEDPAEALIEQLIENEQREGLTTSELAAAVDRLLDLGLSQADIGRRLGRGRDQISMLSAVRRMPEPIRAMAASHGLRTVYDLATAWRGAPEETAAWLEARGSERVTQAEAKAFVARLNAGQAPHLDLLATPLASEAPSVDETPPRSPRASRRAALPAEVAPLTLEVTLRGRPGRVRLASVTGPVESVAVELDDGSSLRVPLSQLKLVRIRPG